MLFKCERYPNITVYTGSSLAKFRNGEYSTDSEDEIKILSSIPYISKDGSGEKAKTKLK